MDQHQDLGFLKNPPPVVPPDFWEYAPGKLLAWNEYGDPAGKPVFYYHGWPSSRLQARLAHHLARERGLRLIAMDRPGMGKSSLLPGRKLEDWPELISHFADHLGITHFGQIGVSGGGPYVLACAAMIPERLTGSAVLAGMVPLPFTASGSGGLHPLYRTLIPLRKGPSQVFSGLFGIAAKVSAGKPDGLILSTLLRSLAASDREIILNEKDLWDVATTSFMEAVSSKSCGRGVMCDSEVYLRKPSFDPAAITHPIHYWHGGDDRNIPAALVEDLVAKMTSANLMVEDGLGHFSLAIRRAPAALDYLANCA